MRENNDLRSRSHPCTNVERRPIPGLSGYYATADGQIIGPQGNVLTLVREYPKVRINFAGHKNARQRRPVHLLVALAFHGPRPAGHDVDHVDRDVANSAASNLRYRPATSNRAVGANVNVNAAKTACLRGHEYTPENTGRDTNGGRYCRACRKVRRDLRALSDGGKS